MAKILEIDKVYRILIIAVLIFFIILVSLAVVVSKIRFTSKPSGTIATVVNEGDLVINYIDGNEIILSGNKIHTFNISITNTSENKIYYSVYFSDINNTNINVEIKDEENNLINSFNQVLRTQKLVNLFSIEGGETKRYKIDIKINDYTNFKATLKVENESLNTNSFSDLILLHNNINLPQSRIGNEISAIDEGLISTIDNRGNSYYFRGNVKNNYVKLGNLLFRIVRINGDYTVRLVLDDVLPTQYAYNTNSLEEGVDVNNLSIFSNSSLVNILNNWVQTELVDYSDYITTGDFCTDTDFSYILNNIRYSKSYERIFYDMAPDLYCTGNIYNGKVGLLSVDEIVLAGAYKNVANDKYYLYNKDIAGNYLTSSTYFINDSNAIAMMNVMTNGALGEGILITNPTYIRPVINISNDAKIKGEGTLDNPYIIIS